MRITIASRIFSPEPSAASYALGRLAARLAEAGHEVTVLTTTPPKGIAIDDPTSLRVLRAPVLRDRNGYVRGYLPYLSFDLPLAFRMLFARRADLYIVEPPPTTGAVVRVVTALLRRPYIYDAADIWSDAARMATSSGAVLSLLRWLELFALRGAAHIVTISTGVVNRLGELGVTTPTTVVGFGADTSTFRYAPSSPPPKQPYFLYAGSYSEWHGADIFVDAFAQFSQQIPGYTLIFIGNGSEREILAERARELGISSIEFRDSVPGNELVPLLAGATASLSSLKPAVGYDYAFTSKVYSSMAVGCPVVFTGPGPTKDFIAKAERTQRSGIAVEYDASSVAAALARFAAHPLAPGERSALGDWTVKNHSLDAVADRIVRVAETLSAQSGRQ